METTIESLQQEALGFINNKQNILLQNFMQIRYETFQSMLVEQKVAQEALALLQGAYNYCTPESVSLVAKQTAHLTKMKYDMKKYHTREQKLAQGVGELDQAIRKLTAVIDKTTAYVAAYPIALNDGARYLKQLTRSKTYTDLCPSGMIGPTRYFDEGFKQYQTQLATPTQSRTPTEGKTSGDK
jgi:hypothetical protein